MICFGDFFKLLNKVLMNVAKKFKEEYGNKVGKFVRLYHKIIGLDELLAHAVGGQVLGGDAIYYACKGCYLFRGSATIYDIRIALEKEGYSSVSDRLFRKRIVMAKELIKKI